jgi:hypothetical protein
MQPKSRQHEVDGKKLYTWCRTTHQTRASAALRVPPSSQNYRGVHRPREVMGVSKVAGLDVQTPYDLPRTFMFFGTRRLHRTQDEAGGICCPVPGEAHMNSASGAAPRR